MSKMVRLLLVDVHKAEESAQENEEEEQEQEQAAGSSLAGHGDTGDEEPGKDEIEGMAIATRVRALLSEGAAAESIAILGRTHRILRYTADALGAAGIAHTLADLLERSPDIAELEINPLIAYPQGRGAVALDALIVKRAAAQAERRPAGSGRGSGGRGRRGHRPGARPGQAGRDRPGDQPRGARRVDRGAALCRRRPGRTAAGRHARGCTSFPAPW